MPNETFRSPNFYDREIDKSSITQNTISGTPAGVIGTSNKGPAFVPVSVGNFNEFISVFGNLDPKHFGPYAVNEFLKHRSALTYMRVLGAGSNASDAEILTTSTTGRTTGAGFYLDGNAASHDSRGRHNGAVQFITAKHTLQASEAYGFPMFTDNDSFTGSTVNLVRGLVMMASGARMMVLDGDESAVAKFTASGPDDVATIASNKFKLVISSTLGNAFYNTDGNSGVKIFTASMNPTDNDYFAKILNTDPDKFVQEQHYLYADFAVDNEIATATAVGVLSGSSNTSGNSGDTALEYRKMFGAFNSRYKTPATSWFISQPFGAAENDLFKFEALDDGEYANNLYKVSIANIKASLDDANPYGTFAIQIRDWNDTDTNPVILEQFSNCSLDPNAENYVAKVVGDRRVTFNFDTTIESDMRVVTFGKYANRSKYVRIVMADKVDKGLVPVKSLPFGFRGPELPKTNDLLTDTSPASSAKRIAGALGASAESSLSGSILPPVPFRYKVTKGAIPSPTTWAGEPGPTELTNPLFYWGVKFERNTTPLNTNIVSEKNPLLSSYTKFLGIRKLDALVTGSGADTFNNNKFTLANVALANTAVSHLTASVNQHMREAAYIRNAHPDSSTHTIADSLGNRITFATILASGEPSDFNRFVQFTKFTNFMAGGFDGVNLLDRDARRLNDKAASFDSGGGAESSYIAPGMLINPAGTGQTNNVVSAYKTAIDVMTNPLVVNTNILAIPGIRESYITDHAMKAVRDYGMALYVMDIASYADDQSRLYDDSTTRPSVDQTANLFDSRGIDNNYVATYFPDVFVDDSTNRRRVKVPASVAAMGALAFNDRVAYPWFAPAGFNRAALDFVSNAVVRLNVTDRDRLSDSRINPIATFPRLGYVIYGQKTLQINKSALDRVNVRRMLLEVKRVITSIANDLVFEQNTPEVRNGFVAEAILRLGFIKAQAGIENFQVIMNETNNTREDVNLNRLNGRIIVVPTRVIEFIAMDFVITQSGISFV